MTEHQSLPVHGYKPQSEEKVALVNEFKQMEERLLRRLDELKTRVLDMRVSGNELAQWSEDVRADGRWLAIARTKFEEAFMALNRAVFQPGRVKLPEDGE